MAPTRWHLPQDRFLDPDPAQRPVARELYQTIAGLPLVCPHGHVDPRLFADPHYSFGSPTELLVIPDHYIFRLLYAQGIPLEALGVPRQDGGPVEQDHRQIWQTFAEHFYLFRGTPTGAWLAAELVELFGVTDKLTRETAQAIYDHIAEQLVKPAFRPRALYDRFNIEVLCTTDAATDSLEHHRAIKQSGWHGNVRPTLRPDAVINIDTPGWPSHIEQLSQVSGIEVDCYPAFLHALEQRRATFKQMGAKATDHAAPTAHTGLLDPNAADRIFQLALRGQATPADARRFTGHMLIEMARLSIDDGLVMQLHVGSVRNHNKELYRRFGPDKGCDIPQRTDFVHDLRPLLEKYGNEPRLTLILFTLDESAYSRELAPLVGHYPALRLGPPWWFFDSLNGIRRYFDRIVETAGIYNTCGFNDDTRAYPSILARHDLWRRASANWVAGLLVRGIIDEEDARAMVHDLAYGLAREAYGLDTEQVATHRKTLAAPPFRH